jgi:hypothetical protein
VSNINTGRRNSFADYKADAHNWITLTRGEYYPDILQEACQLYEPVLVMFGQLLRTSESWVRLFIQISEVPSTWMRVQLFRVFRQNLPDDESRQLSLFNLDESTFNAESLPEKSEMINDFYLYATDTFAWELEDIQRQWREWR